MLPVGICVEFRLAAERLLTVRVDIPVRGFRLGPSQIDPVCCGELRNKLEVRKSPPNPMSDNHTTRVYDSMLGLLSDKDNPTPLVKLNKDVIFQLAF